MPFTNSTISGVNDFGGFEVRQNDQKLTDLIKNGQKLTDLIGRTHICFGGMSVGSGELRPDLIQIMINGCKY